MAQIAIRGLKVTALPTPSISIAGMGTRGYGVRRPETNIPIITDTQILTVPGGFRLTGKVIPMAAFSVVSSTKTVEAPTETGPRFYWK